MANNENGQAYPPGYYFDDKSPDAIPESEMKAKDMIVEVPSENVENTEVPKSELAPAEVAQKRREAIGNFFKNSKERLENGVSAVGGKIKNFFGKVKNTAMNVAIAPDAYVATGYEKLSDFVDNKTEQMGAFVKGRVEMTELVAGFVKDKSLEKLTQIQDGTVARYEGLKKFGVNALEAGAEKIRGINESARNKKNSLIIAILKSVEERHRAKADRLASTITLLQSF